VIGKTWTRNRHVIWCELLLLLTQIHKPHLSAHTDILRTRPRITTTTIGIVVAIITKTHSTRPSKRILCKRPSERLFAADLLTTDKAVNGDGNGAIDIRAAAVFAQSHFGKGFRDAEDGFQMTDLILQMELVKKKKKKKKRKRRRRKKKEENLRLWDKHL
jgi:hypothetical protein